MRGLEWNIDVDGVVDDGVVVVVKFVHENNARDDLLNARCTSSSENIHSVFYNLPRINLSHTSLYFHCTFLTFKKIYQNLTVFLKL
jgi:hypothetical protein